MSELTEEQRRKNMRKYWKAKLSTDYFSKGKHPDEQIIQEIKSRGLDYENMWYAVTCGSQTYNYVQNYLLKEIPLDLNEALTKFITDNSFQITESDWEDALESVLYGFSFIYNGLIKKTVARNITSTETEQLKVLAIILDKSIEDDITELRQKLAEEKRLEEEKKAAESLLENCKAMCQIIVNGAARQMIHNVDKGVSFITEHPDLDEVTSVLNLTIDDIVKMAIKAKHNLIHEERKKIEKDKENKEYSLHRTRYDANEAKGHRNKLIIGFVISLLLGLLWESVLLIIISVCSLVASVQKALKCKKLQEEIPGMEKEIQELTERINNLKL